MDVGVFTAPGNRYGAMNQDYAVIQEFYTPDEVPKGQQQIYITAVCDGHGILGDKAASYAGKALVRHLYNTEVLRKRPLTASSAELQAAMQAGFLRGHNAALSLYDEPPREVHFPSSRRSMAVYTLLPGSAASGGLPVYRNGSMSERLMEFGCTCTCAVVQGRTVCLANVGDSAAVLGSDTGTSYTSTVLTHRHNGHHPDEAARIREGFSEKTKFASDGYMRVIDGPWVGYELAVTRALGHRHMEQYGVIPDPHVTYFEAKPEDVCLVLASDGVWDAMDGQEVVNRVMESAGEGKSAAQIARSIVEDAIELELNSPSREADNTSAIVLLFE